MTTSAPQDTVFEDICFINARHFFAAEAGGAEGDMGDALDLGGGGRPCSVNGAGDGARVTGAPAEICSVFFGLAEIHSASEFADDEDTLCHRPGALC